MSSPQLSLTSGTTLTLTNTHLVVERAGKRLPPIETPFRNVLWASSDHNLVHISLLAKSKPTSPSQLINLEGTVADVDKDAAVFFTETVMNAAYTGLPRQRRLKVFVNPKSGPGKSKAVYHKLVEPVFKAARCKVDLTFTTHGKQAQEIAKTLPLDDYDAIVSMSGDGLIHEIMNGFAAHAEPTRAFCMPITPVPTGSGNGMAINLLGNEDAKDISIAALNAIKGRTMKADLFSVTQGDKRFVSFMTQALGMVADVDLGTESLRFMGGQRFVVGFLYEVLRHRSHPIKVSIKVAHKDKDKMVADMHASRAQAQTAHSESSSPIAGDGDHPQLTNGLPELKYTGPNHAKDDWLTFDKPFTFFYAGKGPYVSADYIQFPVSLPNDGLIDVAIAERTGRLELLKMMDSAPTGGSFWTDKMHYYKAHAYRVEPQTSSGFVSIDGETYPFEPFEVEVHPRMGAFLSMYGYYQVNFDHPAKK